MVYHRFKLFFSVIITTFILLLLSSTSPVNALTVISTTPTRNELNIAANINIEVVFSDNINASTVMGTTFTVTGSISGTHAAAFDVSGTTVTADPGSDFSSGEVVTVTLTTEIESTLGDTLEVSYSWQFTVEASGEFAIFLDSGQSSASLYSTDVKLGDLDSDGDLDAFVANFGAEGGPNKVFLNNGSGIFSDSGKSLGGSASFGVSLGDLDSDGDLDAFVANLWSGNRVWLNDGSGTFTDSDQSLGDSDSYGVSLGDVDGDGDLDAFVAKAYESGSPNKVWLNNGSGTFTDNGQTIGNLNSYGVSLGDVDGDGDLDAFVANSNQPNKVWLNNGLGTFLDSGQSLGNPDSYSYSYGVSLGDVDSDGDLDAFVANRGTANKVWLNNGLGIFSDSEQSLGSSYSNDIVLGDLDGDGDLDAFVVNISEVGYPNKVWLNNGSGIFSDSEQNLGNSYSLGVSLGDLDGDGDLDAFVANGGGDHVNKVWLNVLPLKVSSKSPTANLVDVAVDSDITVQFNQDIDDTTVDGTTFTVDGSISGPQINTISVTCSIVTFNPDNDFEPGETVSVTLTKNIKTAEGISLDDPVTWQFITEASGKFAIFADSGQSLESIYSNCVSLGDVDGDGDLDAFVTNSFVGGKPSKVFFNDGLGTFTIGEQSLGNSNSNDAALGDLDSDGDLDAFVANNGANKVWLNNGEGIFTDSGQNLGGSDSYGVSLGDVDGDGDLDAFVANAYEEDVFNKIWLNDGSGTFTDSGQSIGNSNSLDVSLGDVDDDGDLDAFVANNGANKVWLNDGEGTFSDSEQSLDRSDSRGVSLGDVDGDGDLDAFIANGGANKVWLNGDGSGTFTDSGQSLDSSYSMGIALADLDGDGDLDAYVVNIGEGGDPNRVWLNNAGTFTDSGLSLGYSDSYGVSLGDVDNDGDIDAIVANRYQVNRVWMNMPLELTITDTLGVEDSDTMSFIVSIADTCQLPVTVDFTTSDGTAVAGNDYTALSGTLTIPVGSSADTIVVSITDDILDEDDEFFTVILSNPGNATFGDSLGVGTITDNDEEMIPEKITITSPNGGEWWFPGSEQEITWTCFYDASVIIEYSIDGGSNWEIIISGALNLYRWVVPEVYSATCLVRITSLFFFNTVDQSDNVFTIFPSTIQPPSDIAITPDLDDPEKFIISWTPSPDEAIITGYGIYRSLNPDLTEPIPAESFSSEDELTETEKTATIHIASVSRGESSYGDSYKHSTGVTYYYWMEAIAEKCCSEKVLGTIDVEAGIDVTPLEFRVDLPYPNPFNPTVTIQYHVPKDCHVDLVIYNITGKNIAVLHNSMETAGIHRTVWDGTDNNGVPVSSGMYLYRFSAGTYTTQGKIMFLK